MVGAPYPPEGAAEGWNRRASRGISTGGTGQVIVRQRLGAVRLTEKEQQGGSSSPVEVDGDGVVGVEQLGGLLNLLLHELVLKQVHNRLCNYNRSFHSLLSMISKQHLLFVK